MVKPNPRCILDNPETDCIKNPTEVLQGSIAGDSNPLGYDKTTKAGKVGLSYIESLVTSKPELIKAKCGGILGNKFLYEYGKCKDPEGNIQTRYKYIDATCGGTSGFGLSTDGVLPCTINSAAEVGGAAVGIPMAIFDNAVPECSKVNNIECNVSNKDSANFADVTSAYIANGDETGGGVRESFNNLYESVNEYMKENDLNFSNIKDEKASNSNKLKNDSTINEMYYIMLMLFFLFIIYKLIHKK